MALCLTDKQG